MEVLGMAKVLMKGNEAIAEGALRAGCRFYAGYPITPQSEILEYMAKNMEDRGGVFIQGESEISSISMVWGASAAGVRSMTSSSGPGFSLKQEGISFIASYCLPAVIVNVVRYGIGCGDVTPGQDSYLQAVKGGGHGDYRLIVLAPATVTENAQLTYEAFDLAEKWRNPVLVLADGVMGQMVEQCELPEAKEHDPDQCDWAIKGRPLTEKSNKATNWNYYIGDEAWAKIQREKYHAILQEEQRWEEVETKDAEVVLVAYGISARVCKQAVKDARSHGIKLGLIRPITLWPFPRKAFEKLDENVKGLMAVEMSIFAQISEDISMACKYRFPIYAHATAINVPESEDIILKAQEILAGNLVPVEVL
jgi:2-oxoglutarate ferredoxin oxidoreductase subunit alpha